MKWNELLFSLLANLKGNVSVYAALYQFLVRNWKSVYLPQLFRISAKIKF